MCGIAGYVRRDRDASLPVVRAMCEPIRYRGPDDEGYHVDGGCALGMRRLSIIDLAGGRQPISSEDGGVWVVCNGEIYNFQALRRELIGRGHRFATHSDTEVLVHLYEQEGVEGLARLRGMFAVALWDAPRRRLLLARDPFGKKPLYYAALADGLYFGSEIKCLRAAGVPLEPDREALRWYFQFAYIPDPFSAFADVRKLPPGGWALYQDGALRQGRYWRPPAPAAAAPPSTEAEAAGRLRQAFDEAVRLRLVADVPLGAFLSGGIDSSAVVASMALQSREPVRTFSIGFDERSYNELPYAAAVARKYGTDHHELVVRPDAVQLVTRLVRHFDEPFGDSSALPAFLVSEFAARHVKVALSGDGGDELFAGYPRFQNLPGQHIPRPARRVLGALAAALPYSAYGKNHLYTLSRDSAFQRYCERNYANYYLRRELLRPEWMLPADAAYLERVFADALLDAGADILSRVLYFEAAVNLPGDMLVKVDRMSMAHSLEVRCPMLDTELAALAATFPHHWWIRGGRGKYLLIRAMADRFPPELLRRPKMGFAAPVAEWFRGPLRAMLHDHLAGPPFLDRGLVSPPFLRQMLDEHQRGRRDHSYWLWSLLMLELWWREMEATAVARPPATPRLDARGARA